jgi:hypothetical protein
MAAGRDKVGSAQLLTALRDALKCRHEEVPDGWKTVHQLAEEWGFSVSHASRLITMGVRKGLIECRRFRITNGNRGVFPVQHYRQIQ